MEEVKKRMFVVMEGVGLQDGHYFEYKPLATSSDLKKVQDCVDELRSGKDQRTAYYVEVKELE